MRQFFIGFLIVAALVAGGSLVASVAYQAGLSTAVTTVAATAPDGTIVTPVIPGGVPGYGYGYGPGWGWHGGGFSIVGFLFTLFFIFLFIGLLRAAFGRGRGWGGGRGGWGGRGGLGSHDHNGERPWERQAKDTFESWHRESHGESGGNPPTDRPSPGAPGA